MNRTNPAKLRHSLQMAHELAKSGIGFVCMPVVDEADGKNLDDQARQRLERMALIAGSKGKRA